MLELPNRLMTDFFRTVQGPCTTLWRDELGTVWKELWESYRSSQTGQVCYECTDRVELPPLVK